MSQFDYLQNLITNNPDGTVTIGGNTYATDGSGLVENYGGLTRAQLDAADAAQNDPFGTMAANAFMEELPDGTKVFNPAGDGTDFGQLLIDGGATPGLGNNLITDDTIIGAGTDTVDAGAGNDTIIGAGTGTGTDTVDGVGTDTVDGVGTVDELPLDLPPSTSQELYDALVARGLGSEGEFFLQGSSTLDDIIGRYGGDESFMDLVNRFDPTTRPEFTGDYTYNPNNPGFGAETGRNQVYYIDPTTNKPAMGLGSEVNALYPGITTYNSAINLSQQNPGAFDSGYETPVVDTTTNTGPNYEDMYGSLANEYQRLLDQQNQPSNDTTGLNIGQPIQTGSQDMNGLMGLLNQFMQSRNSLQGGGRYGNQYGSMYGGMGGGMGYNSPYGNPFNSGMGYGYGMNPYSGGIGSFYGNTGLGFSPSGYNSGYGSGYGQNNMFYGGYGGNNYNQQQQMAYNPYSSLYNQLSNPQTYGYSGETYTPEYNSYLNTQYEGDKYSQGYQDYLQSNNPGVYNNLFGGSI